MYEKTNNDTLLLGTYCGTTAPPVFVSQNIFIILFVSDISNSGRGFRAGFYKLDGMQIYYVIVLNIGILFCNLF